MALSFKFYSLIFLLSLLFMVLEGSSGCKTGEKCFYGDAASLVDFKSRKVLVVSRGDVRGEPTSNSTGNGEELEIRELRAVPSGPDPLHHNGGSPKKPRTP
ncbi:hypothetical protein Peur_074426 [Populus x canadensis]